MREKLSCFSDNSVSFSSPSCSTSTPTSASLINSGKVGSSPVPSPLPSPSSLLPSIQNAVTCVYRTRLRSSQSQTHVLITLSWFRSLVLGQSGLSMTFGHDADANSSSSFKLSSNSRLFKKNRGSKKIEFAKSLVQIFWDFSNARYDRGPEPLDGFYVVVLVDSELGLLLGDMMAEDAVAKKFRTCNQTVPKFSLVSRREHFSGNSLYRTRSRFGNADIEHDIAIKISGESEELKSSVLSVYIDKKKVMRVKRLQWNFRGSQTIFVEGTNLMVDMFWDVHDWFFSPTSNGCGVFMFSTTSGLMDGRFWSDQEEQLVEELKSPQEEAFSFLIYATKSSS